MLLLLWCFSPSGVALGHRTHTSDIAAQFKCQWSLCWSLSHCCSHAKMLLWCCRYHRMQYACPDYYFPQGNICAIGPVAVKVAEVISCSVLDVTPFFLYWWSNSKHSWFPPMVRGTYEALTSLDVWYKPENGIFITWYNESLTCCFQVVVLCLRKHILVSKGRLPY